MTIQVSGFRWVPPFAQGHVRDLRVRWALEEAGLPYEATLLSRDDQASQDYRDWQPFGQVPAYRDGEVEMFESGAIVLYLSRKSPALAPEDEAGRARVATWILAALNSIEPHVAGLASTDIFHKGEAWTVERRPQIVEMVATRLKSLSDWLGDREHLDGRFSAGDLIMACVLRDVPDEIMTRFPTLVAYRARCLARPAFARALEAQLQPFRENAPAGA
jgi:glutathione S-transferase